MRKVWDIPGGIHPPENKRQSLQSPIATIPLPDQVILPLNQHIGAAATPIVAVGNTVKTGQMIAEAEGVFSAPVHASVSGTVTAIEDRVIAHASGLSTLCIVIDSDGNDEHVPYNANEDYRSLSHEALVQKIHQAGIAGMGGAGFPTAVKLNPNAANPIDTLIINGTECEPYITADDILMQERADAIIKGTDVLAHVLGRPVKVIIGIEDNKPDAYEQMCVAAKGFPFEIVTFPTKYPSGGEKQLIQILTGKEVESGQIPAKLGIVVQNTGTAAAVWEAVRYGKPLIERVTTVVGEALDVQRNIAVRLGTPIDHVLALHGFHPQKSARLIIGGPMMGFAIEQTHVPVVKTTNCILVPSKQEMPNPPPAQACIRCGHCAEVCPANLLPQQLYWYTQAEDTPKLEAHNLFDCIECGACSYVCPSAIPLVQYYRAAKGSIRQHREEKKKSDQARERFEHRKERIAAAEAVKEAKRLKRKQAAEDAKKKLSHADADTSKPSTGTSTTSTDISKTSTETSNTSTDKTSTTDKVTHSLSTNTDDPAKTQGKLERALTSAKNRMERVQKQLEIAQEDGDETKIGKALAQQKQAQLKIDQAHEKLDAFLKFDASQKQNPSQKHSNNPTH